MKRRFLLWILIIILTKPFMYGQNHELKTRIDQYFEKHASRHGKKKSGTALSVVITSQDKVLFSGHYGTADIENNTPVSDSTIYDLASVSKQFTGMGISLLEQRGKLSGQDKIIQYIPELPPIMEEISIDQLLHHTSGIRDWPILFGLQGKQMDEEISIDQIINLLKKQEGLNFKPGTSYSYSNSNYNLLARIIENVTDTPIQTWMHTNIFQPLKMTQTYYSEDYHQPNREEAKSYTPTKQGFRIVNNKLYAPGSSSLRSNTKDMSRWMINFYTKQLGGEEAFLRMTQKGYLMNSESVDYGRGIQLSEINHHKAFLHDGSWAGFRTGTVFLPETGIGIVILCNDASFSPIKAMSDIVAMLAPEPEMVERTPEIANKQDVEINDAFFKLCEGKYEQIEDRGTFLTFFKENNEYFLNFDDQKTFKLYASSDSVYYIKEVDAEFIFHLENGEVNSHSLHQNGRYHKALKVIPGKEDSGIHYKNLEGDYFSNELDIRYRVVYKRKKLMILIPGISSAIYLEHVKELTFTGNTRLIQSITFQQHNNKTEGFIINNSRATGLQFKKVNP